MRRGLAIALFALLFPAATAGAVVFPPVEPPPLPTLSPEQPLPSGPATLWVKQRFDPSKGTPVEGYTGYVDVTRLKNGQKVTQQGLPLELPLAAGEYRVTSYWRTGSGAGTIDPATNFCSAKVQLRRGGRTNLVVNRDARGCAIKVRAGKAKRKCTGRGEERRCRKVKRKAKPEPERPQLTPPCCKPFPTLRILPLNHDFGSVPVGGASAPVTFTLKNISTGAKGPIGIDFDFNSTDFPISADACTGTTLSAEEECTFDMTFTPLIPGFSVDSLIPVYPGGNGGAATGIRGTGV